ncbi:MAG TPA: hypothetical protein DCM10_08890, partial [Xanthomarina gelatinilytica]|nr:hypothetical protein [Xanthomarina gelatinilytica]
AETVVFNIKIESQYKNMERNDKLASAICSKEFHKLETDFKYNSFYTESDKRIIRTLIGNRDPRQFVESDIINAIDLAKKLISMNCAESNYYSERLETLEKTLKDF